MNMSVSQIVTLNQNKNKFTKKKASSKNRMIRKYTKKLPSRNLKDILTLNQKEKILLRTTKWNIKQKCAEIGKNLENANFKTLAHLLMVIMSWIKRSICHQIIKPKFVLNSIPPVFALMEIDASSCIHSMISIVNSIMPNSQQYYLRMLGWQWIDSVYSMMRLSLNT